MKKANYYQYICAKMKAADENKKDIEAEYCAMHALMILESLNGSNDITNDHINFTKEDYEHILSLVERHQKRYMKYRRINLIKSFLGIIGLFIVLIFIVKSDPKSAAAVSMFLLLYVVYRNGKDSKEKYKQWQMNLIEKNVSNEIVEQNKKYFKEAGYENI